jgi:hypothetical protein
MTRPHWRVLLDGEEPPAGRAAQDIGDGRRAWFDDLACIDDDDDDDADVAADAVTAAEGDGATPGNGAAAAAALREAATRLAGLSEEARAVQRRPEARRLGVRAADLDKAIRRALAAIAAAATERQAEAEASAGFTTTNQPEETLDDVVQRLAAIDGLDYVTALGEAARRFKIPVTALEQAVRRKREPPPVQPATTQIVLPRRFTLDETGLWYQPLPSARNPDPRPVFVCGPFKVLGEARDLESRAWGVAITWFDHDRRPHIWSCPQRLVHLDGNAIAAELADAGLTCATSKEAHELLKQFFGSLRTSHRLQSAERTGWHATSAHAGIVAHDATVITQGSP